jgi:SacI homology domain
MSSPVAPSTDSASERPQSETAELSSQEASPATTEADHQHTASEEGIPGQKPSHEAAVEMLPKILRTTKLLLTSQSFFFSYDINLTKRFGNSSVTSVRSLSLESVEQQVGESSTCPEVFQLTILSIFGIDS